MNLSSLLTLLGFLFFRAQSIDHKHSKASFESNTNLSVQKIPYSSIYKVGSEKYVNELSMHKRKLISAQKTKSFVRLLASRGNSGFSTIIHYAPLAQIGIESNVYMEIRPPMPDFIFYIYVANTCKRNQYTLHCERTNPGDSNHKEDYLETPIVKRMAYVGNGFYEETYTISHTKTGYVTVSTYQMMHGVRGLCYDNEDFLGSPVKTLIDTQIAYNWGNAGLCGEGLKVKSLMFKGRLLVPETGTYQLRADKSILIRLVLIGYYEEEAFQSNSFLTLPDLSAGEYDYIIHAKANGELPQAVLYWEILSSSGEVLVPSTNLLYVTTHLTAGNVETTCYFGHYLSVTMKSCLECPEGTYANQYGLTECTRCNPGTFNEEMKATICEECPAMTYGDRFGLTKCTPCPPRSFTYNRGSIECIMCDPLCSECFGPYNTQCDSCVENTGAFFTFPNTCQCPDGTYYESYFNKCTHCHPLCSSCTGHLSTQCKGCNTSIAYGVEDLPFLCVTECPEGYYRNFSSCESIFLINST